jgi:hypothetical protein
MSATAVNTIRFIAIPFPNIGAWPWAEASRVNLAICRKRDGNRVAALIEAEICY